MDDRRASAHGAALAAYERHYGNGARLPREVVAAFLHDYERLRGDGREPHPRVAFYPDTLGSETIAAYEAERFPALAVKV